MYNIKKGR